MEKIILMIDKLVEKSRRLKVNLENNDYRVLITKDVNEALMLVTSNNIDMLIIFDVDIELEKLKNENKLKNVPILGIFAENFKERVDKANLADYIFEPYDKEQLYLKIKNQVKISKLQKQVEIKELELKKAYEELNNFGLIDKVTGLYNSFYFKHIIKNLIASSKRYGYQLSGIMIKVDNYTKDTEKLNIIYKMVAEVIKKSIRNNDILVRLNSEELYLILPHTGLKDAVFVAGKLQKLINEFNFKDNEEITISSGVTSLGNFESGLSKEEELVNDARDALKEAIKEGGNKVVWH